MNPRRYTVDIGNSSVGIGFLDNGQWVIRRVDDPDRAAGMVDGPAFAISVAPERLARFQRALAGHGLDPAVELRRPPPQLVAEAPGLLATAGADRLANALAAMPGPAIAVDAGTAVTVDVVDGDGVYRGGFIAAGPGAAGAGLGLVTALLPRASGAPAPVVPGTDTAGALAAGLWGSAVGGVDRLVASALLALDSRADVRMLATGGWGAAWAAASSHQGVQFDPALVHRGIALWAGWK